MEFTKYFLIICILLDDFSYKSKHFINMIDAKFV